MTKKLSEATSELERQVILRDRIAARLDNPDVKTYELAQLSAQLRAIEKRIDELGGEAVLQAPHAPTGSIATLTDKQTLLLGEPGSWARALALDADTDWQGQPLWETEREMTAQHIREHAQGHGGELPDCCTSPMPRTVGLPYDQPATATETDIRAAADEPNQVLIQPKHGHAPVNQAILEDALHHFRTVGEVPANWSSDGISQDGVHGPTRGR